MLLFVFLLCGLAHAQISIDIHVASREEDVEIRMAGKEQHDITESEKRAFGLSPSDLQRLCSNYDDRKHGTRGVPAGAVDCVLSDVTTTIQPIMATILALDIEPTVLAVHKFENLDTRTVEHRVDLSQTLTNNITHTCEDTQIDGIADSAISAGVSMFIENIAGSASFSYDHQLGTNENRSHTITVRSAAGITVPVEMSRTIEASMTGSHGSMDIQILYDIIVSGKVLIDYTPGMPSDVVSADIDEIMEQNGVASGRRITETIKIDFYTDLEVKVTTPMGPHSKSEKTDL